MKGHSPQDEMYGPLSIPSYCWPFIDTPEFQRLRYIPQLGCANFVYPGATHTRFEHCLGVAHLAVKFMENIQIQQKEIEIKPEHIQAVVLAGLCHDIGHGPWSHCFEAIAHKYDPEWDHEEMSVKIMKYIVQNYKIDIDPEIVDAAGDFIRGVEHPPYPKWLSRIIANHDCDIDLDKFDYLSRDKNRSCAITNFEYERLIVHCRVVEGELAWRISEIPTIDRLFYNRNNMHERVYQHRVNQAIGLMVSDMLFEADPFLEIEERLSDIPRFCSLDCRLQYLIESGLCGEAAQNIAIRMKRRQLYTCIGELREDPTTERTTFSQEPTNQLLNEIASYGNVPADKMRIAKLSFRYGLNKNFHPLLCINFWSGNHDKIIRLNEDDISCIVPIHYVEVGLRIYVTDKTLMYEAKKQFESWKKDQGIV